MYTDDKYNNNDNDNNNYNDNGEKNEKCNYDINNYNIKTRPYNDSPSLI